jgi:hypothetical protein
VRLWEDQLVTEPASVATAHTPSDRIMDHKPVLVSWNHADKLLQPVIKLRDFLKCRRGNNSTVVNSSHRSSHRSRQPARGLDGGTNIAPVYVEPFRTTLETIGSRIPFTCRSFHRYTLLGDARRQRQPWCCSYLWTGQRSKSQRLPGESESGPFFSARNMYLLD